MPRLPTILLSVLLLALPLCSLSQLQDLDLNAAAAPPFAAPLTEQQLPVQQVGATRQVCLASWEPISNCDPSQPTPTYTGYDVDVWRNVAVGLGWIEGFDWEFVCLGFSTMIDELRKTNDSRCQLGTGGITISREREELGIQFSYPTYRSSLSVMIRATEEQPDGWFFLKPLEWSVWLALGLTALFLPTIAFMIEFLAIQGRIMKHDWYRGIKEATWRGVWTVLLYEPFHVTSASARTVALMFGFCMLILINIYCASLTTFLTVSQLDTDITKVDDLRGKAVGTVSVYKPRLARYGISGTSLDFDGISSAPDWIAALRNGSLTATAVDEPFQQYVAAMYGCDLRVLRESFEPFDYGIAFQAGVPPDEVSRVSEMVLNLQGDGTLSSLRSQYIAIPNSECEEPQIASEATPISFDQLYGIWVILGAAAAVSLLVLLFTPFETRRRRLKHQQTKEREQAIRLAAPAIKPDTSINIAAAVKSKLMRRLSSGKHFTTNNKSCHDGKDASISSAAKLSLTLGLGGGGTGDLQSIGALVVIVRELCEGYEDLKRRYEELQGRYQTFEGYRDADGDYIVDENIGNVPLEEDTDFEDCQSYHSMK